MVGVGWVAAAVYGVGVGVGFSRFLPKAACAAMGWHALIPARCFSALIPRAGGSSLVRAAMPAAIVRRLPDIVFFVVVVRDVDPICWCGSGCPGLSSRRVGPRRLPFLSPATVPAGWTALILVDPLPPFISHGPVRRARIFVHVAILRLIADPAVLHGCVLWLFCAPYFHEAAPSHGGHCIHQRSLMLGPLLPDDFPLLIVRSGSE